MEKPTVFDLSKRFPTKATMKQVERKNKVPVVSNHFKVAKPGKDEGFMEWAVSFIRKEDYQKHKDSNSVKQDAVAPDSRYIISMIWKENRPLIDKKIGRHMLTGMTIFSSEKIGKDLKSLDFSNHKEFVLLLNQKNDRVSLDQISNGENKFEFLRYMNANLKEKLREDNFVEIGTNKKYYNKDLTQRVNVGDFKYLVYCGYKTAYDIYEGGLRLLVDYSTRIIHETSVWEDVKYYRNAKNLHDKIIIDEYIQDRSVWTTYSSQKSYRIDEVTNLTINSPFPNPEYKNYADYFLKRYKIQLKDPKQFMLKHNQQIKEKNSEGKVIKVTVNEIILPSELVRSTGIPEEERGNYQVMKAFAEYTCLPPDQRFVLINNLMKTINKKDTIKDRNGAVVDPTNTRVDPNSNQCQGTILQKPKIITSQSGNGSVPQKDKIDLKNVYNAKSLTNWMMVSEPFMDRNIDIVIDNLISSSKRFGIEMSDPTFTLFLPKNGSMSDLEDTMNKQKNYKKPDIILVLIGKKGANQTYKKMKAHFHNLGIPLQFFVSFNPKRDEKANSKYSNIVLQMINKLGSNLWCIERTVNSTLVLGSTTANASKNRSICSVVSQYGKNFSKSFSAFKIAGDQSPKNVSIAMTDLVIEHVENYLKVNGNVPESLIIYRQGTSEGQLKTLVDDETQKIVDGLQDKYGAKRPRVLFIIVTKKIDDRFAIAQGKRFDNPECGLTVDGDVVKVGYANFFLVAQFVNQGSANPTHYALVYNETSFVFNDVQAITNELCWAYTNWMGPIKVPAPLQYANKLVALTSLVLNDKVKGNLQQTPYYL